jgi:hypothetical protein
MSENTQNDTLIFTLGELKSIEESLRKITTLSLPVKVSYRLSKCLTKISKELGFLEEQRMNLVRKYGTAVEETGEIKVTTENMPDFVKEYNELLQEELRIEFSPISLDSVENLELTPLDMVQLEKFFKE